MSTTTHRRRWLAAITTALAMTAVAGCGSVKQDDGGSGGESKELAYLTDSCTDYQPTEGITDDTIKIGYSGALGGPFATVGTGLWGMLGYFDMVNSEGGVKGPDGKTRKIKVVYKDDQYQVATAKANVQELVDSDKVFGLIGIVGSSANQAIRPIVSSGCVPDLFATAGAPELGDPAYPWEINGAVSVYSGEGATYANYLKQNMPDATVAFMYQNDDYGRAEIGSFKDGIAGSNIKVAKEVTFETTDADLSNQVTTLAATKADVAISIGLGAQSLQAISRLASHPTWKPQIISAPIAVSQLSQLPDGVGDGLLTGMNLNIDSPAMQSDPKVQKFMKWVKPIYDKNNVKLPPSTGVGGWNAAALFVQTVQGASEMTRAGIMDSAHNLTPKMDDIIFIDGLTLQTTPSDPYLVEGMVIGRWDASKKDLTAVQTINLNGEVKFKSYK